MKAHVLTAVSELALPIAVFGILAFGVYRKVNVYETFVAGAKEGLIVVWNIAPYLLTMLVAIRVFQDSRAMQALINGLHPIGKAIGAPEEVLPLALLRPLSGTGALGMLSNILQSYGPDSRIGLIASTLQGSTETTFYILTIYFGAVRITKARHAPVVGFLADLAGFLASVFFVDWLLF